MKLNLSAGFNMLGRIMTCIVLFSSIFIYFTWGIDASLDVSLMWEELGVSFLTSLPFFFSNEKKKSVGSRVFSLFRLYLYINAIVLVAGFVFEWYDLTNPVMLVLMLLTIFIVFVAVTVITYCVDKQSADEINQQLNERRNRRPAMKSQA